MPSIRATAQATPRSSSTGQFIQARISPAIRAAVDVAVKTVLEDAQRRVPVRTGELRDSGYTSVDETDKTVVGHVGFAANHAAYVEWGTGQRGAESAGAGKGPYSTSWKGMPAQPYLRPAMDSTRETIRELLASQIALALK